MTDSKYQADLLLWTPGAFSKQGEASSETEYGCLCSSIRFKKHIHCKNASDLVDFPYFKMVNVETKRDII